MYEEPTSVTIVRRDSSGQPVFIYPPHCIQSDCIVESINYAKGYFHVARVQSALLAFAETHEQTVPNGWYRDVYLSARHVKNHYMASIFSIFCMVAVDPTIRNPDCLGGRCNRKWEDRFNPRDHCILLNASRVDDMVAAYERVMSSNCTDYDIKNLNTFRFNLANTFFREICSLFVTFVTNGREVKLPSEVGEQKQPRMLDKDEFAREMEIVLFRGKMIYFCDPFGDASQSGIPHVVTKDGARKVSQQSINDRVQKVNIGKKVHIALEGRIIGIGTRTTLGRFYPPAILTDPMNWAIMHYFKDQEHGAHVDTPSGSHRPPVHPGYPTQAASAGMPGGSGGRR